MVRMKTKPRKLISDPVRTLRLSRDYTLRKLLAQPQTGSILRAITPQPRPKRWVFIVGCYNSGTSLLLKMLGSHKSVSTLDEGVFSTSQLITPEELGWTRMWCKVVPQVRLQQGDTSVDSVALKKDWSYFLDSHKPVYIEKSIVNSARMGWLQENFDDPYFIFIVRNGYAVAEGIRRKIASARRWPIPAEYGDTYPIELCAEQWVVNNEVIEQDAPNTRNLRRITYEELIASPKQVVESLWEYIGLTPEVGWFDNEKKWSIHEKNASVQDMNQRSFDRLSPDDITKIEAFASAMLLHYGYPLLSKRQDRS